jgi:pimeloyl-ACP methyl ester carboxylesterase
MADIAYRMADVDGLKVFYREAGASDSPTLVLLHGFPSASHMFRELIPLLADRFHIVAPDLPGFGKSDMPARGDFGYTFEHITDVIDRLTETLGLDRFALYVFDYGAPVGFRIAARHPERITAIISQNGNAYEEGLSDGWNPIQAYWKEPSRANREAIRTLLEPQTTIWQYTHGVPDQTRVSPDGYGLDNHYLARSGADEIQLDLSSTTRATWGSTPRFRTTSAPAGRRCSRSGAATTRSSCQPGPKPSSATSPTPTFVSSTPVTSPSRPTSRRSQPRSASSSPNRRHTMRRPHRAVPNRQDVTAAPTARRPDQAPHGRTGAVPPFGHVIGSKATSSGATLGVAVRDLRSTR